MPRVLNIYKATAGEIAEAVYIGRNHGGGSDWGNPFRIGIDGDRAEVIAKFEEQVQKMPSRYIEKVKAELKGKDLACFCAPLPCHGDILLRIANEEA